jgi:GT2 family glycosyltransferase
VPRICPVTGALMLIRYETIKKIGIFDENFKMGFEDVDYCHMVFQAGMKCAYEPRAEAVHHESLFRRNNPSERLQKRSEESWQYLHEKHKGMGFADYVPTMIWDEE